MMFIYNGTARYIQVKVHLGLKDPPLHLGRMSINWQAGLLFALMFIILGNVLAQFHKGMPVHK